VSVFNLFAVSVFWGFMADRFDPSAATRRFGLVALGGTLGAMAGAAVTGIVVEQIGERPLLVVAALLLELATLSYGRISDDDRTPAPPQQPRRATLAFVVDLARSRYLSGVAAYLLLYALTSTFAYLEQGRIVAATVSGDAARTALFARMDLAVNVLALLLQAFATAPLLRRLGTAGTLAILPAVTLVGFGWLAWQRTRSSLIVFQVLRRALDFGAARPARETCYTVVAREQKYALKSFIDGFVYRTGDVVGANLFGLFGAAALTWGLPLCALWLAVALFVGVRQAALARARDD
jgi:AAA family ATP:ADP antiporter